MSPLTLPHNFRQASRKFHVPSRTLYDKIKKLGIPTMPRRYPRSVTAVPPSPVPAFPTPPPAAAEDDSSQPGGGGTQRTNGTAPGTTQRQPMELVVPRRRPSGGGLERELGEDGLKREAALCGPLVPGLRPVGGLPPVSFPPSAEEERRRPNGDADLQRQPMELVVGRRHPSLERELAADGLKLPRDEAEEARELDVVA